MTSLAAFSGFGTVRAIGGNYILTLPNQVLSIDTSNATGPGTLNLGPGLSTVSLGSGGNTVNFGSGGATVTGGGAAGNFGAAFDLNFSSGSVAASLNNSDNGSQYNFGTGSVKLAITNATYNSFNFGAGSANVALQGALYGTENVQLSTGLVVFDASQATGDRIFVTAASSTDIHAGDVLNGPSGTASNFPNTLALMQSVGVYDLSQITLNGIQNLQLSGAVVDGDNNLSGFSAITGTGEIDFSGSNSDLSNTGVSSNIKIVSNNVNGTSFIVKDIQSALDIIGSSGNDTISTQAFTFTAAQRETIFEQSPVKSITDPSGTYMTPIARAPAKPTLTAASDTGSSASDGITKDTTPTLTGGAGAKQIITLYDGNTKVGTAVASSTGAYSITSSALADGSHNLSVTATAVSGNVSAPSASLAIVIDSTAPTAAAAPTLTVASDTGSSSTDGITSVTTPTITGTAEAGSTVKLYDGQTIISTVMANSAGVYSVTSPTLAAGSHYLKVTQTDAAGNSSGYSAGKTIVIDTTMPQAPKAPTLTAASDTGSSASDGITKDATPTLTGTAEAKSIITLYDGTMKVGTATASATGAYSITASTLANGSHTLTVTATDTAGNVSAASPGLAIVIDTVIPATPAAPTINAASDTGTSVTDGITNVTTPTVSGTAEAGATVTLLDAKAVVGSAVADSNGAYSITSSTLAEGSHALTVTATDAAGNVSKASTARTVVIDTAPPATPAVPTLAAASDTGVSATDGITNDTTPTLTGTAEAKSTITLYDGTTKVGTAIAGATGAYSITASALANGSHSLTVTATDAAGNVSAASPAVAIVVDTTAPLAPTALNLSAASDTGTSSSDGITSVNAPTFTGKAEAGSTVTLFDGTTKVGSAVADSSGAFTISSSSLSDGSHKMSVKATDTAGNVGSSSAAKTIVIDTSAPAVSITGAGGSTTSVSQTIAGTGEAGTTIKVFDGAAQVGIATVLSSGAWSTKISLASGSNVITATDTDKAGNTGTSNAVTYTLNTTAPKVTEILASDTGASASDKITSNAALSGSGNANAIVHFTVDGVSVSGTATANASGAWTFVPTGLADGSHTIVASETDGSGHTGTASLTFTVDATAPNVTDVLTSDTGSSAGDRVTSNPSLTGSGDANAIVHFTVDGASISATAQANAGGAWTFLPTGLADGSHTLVASETDAAGNTGAASLTFTLDMTPPNVLETLTSDTGASLSDGITTNASLSGSGDANALVTFTVDGTVLSGTATASTSGAWTFVPTGLADGSHTIIASETDSAGNTGTASRTFTLDTTAPVLVESLANDTGPSSSDKITSIASLTGSGDANAFVTFTVDGTVVSGTATANASGAWTFVPNGLADGSHSIVASETDAAGNTGTASLSFTLDRSAPNVLESLKSDTGASAMDKITSSAVLTGSGDAGAVVHFTVDGAAVAATATANASGAWTFSPTGLADGSHAIVASETDTAGNTGSTSLTFTLDKTAPQVTESLTGDTGSSASDKITRNGSLTGSGDANAIVKFTVDGAALATTATANASGAWTFSPTGLADGSHTIVTSETDAAGNIGTASLTYTLDTTVPALAESLTSDSGPSSSDRITSNSAISGSGDANAIVQLLIDGVAATATANAAGAWTYTPTGLADGTHTIVASETDVAGNTATASLQFTLDTTPPVLTVTSTGVLTYVASQLISGSAAATDAGSTVTIFDGGTNFGSAIVQADGSWSTSIQLINGSNSITASITDLAGNVGQTPPATTFTLQQATITWKNAGDGAWGTSANWTPKAVPASTDNVWINSPVAVTFSTGKVTINELVTAPSSSLLVTGGSLAIANGANIAGPLALSSGTLTASAATTIGNLQQTGGELNGAGTAMVTGLSALTGGTQSGSGTTIAQGGALFTNSYFYLDGGRTLQLGGSSKATGSQVVIDLNGTNPSTGVSDVGSGTLTIAAGATFDDQTTSQLYLTASSQGGTDTGATASVINRGTFKKTGTASSSQINTTFSTVNGTVDVESGILVLNAGGTDVGASYIGPGTVQFNGGTRTLDATSSVTGNTIVNSGQVTFNAALNAASVTTSGGTLTLVGGGKTATFTESGGELNGAGTLTVSGAVDAHGGHAKRVRHDHRAGRRFVRKQLFLPRRRPNAAVGWYQQSDGVTGRHRPEWHQS